MVTNETVPGTDAADSGNTLSKLRQTLSSSLMNAQDKGKSDFSWPPDRRTARPNRNPNPDPNPNRVSGNRNRIRRESLKVFLSSTPVVSHAYYTIGAVVVCCCFSPALRLRFSISSKDGPTCLFQSLLQEEITTRDSLKPNPFVLERGPLGN